jgi:hypothetical protein
MRLNTIVFAVALGTAPLVASAHAPKVGHNGGPQTDAGSYHVEVLPQGKTLRVFLHDHSDKSVDTKGFKGTAIFVIEGKPQRITLTPAGANTLQGEAEVAIPNPPKGAVQITTPAGSTVQGKF